MRFDAKAIIFDWGRTLYNSETKREFPEAERVLAELKKRGYRLAVVSIVSVHANATLEERKRQIETSPLRTFFETVLVTDTDKDVIMDTTVRVLALPREKTLIVDDRTVRGIRYGNWHGHPTVWLRQGKFADELPTADTGEPSYTIRSLEELLGVLP